MIGMPGGENALPMMHRMEAEEKRLKMLANETFEQRRERLLSSDFDDDALSYIIWALTAPLTSLSVVSNEISGLALACASIATAGFFSLTRSMIKASKAQHETAYNHRESIYQLAASTEKERMKIQQADMNILDCKTKTVQKKIIQASSPVIFLATYNLVNETINGWQLIQPAMEQIPHGFTFVGLSSLIVATFYSVASQSDTDGHSVLDYQTMTIKRRGPKPALS